MIEFEKYCIFILQSKKEREMRYYVVIKAVVLIIIMYMLGGCGPSGVHAPELLLAERIMEEHPDSALHILKQMPDSFYMDDENQALYGLLLTEAMDKTYAVHTTDSLIAFAAQYYEQTDDTHHKAKAWYYWGRVSQDLLYRDRALECYLKAIPYAQQTKFYRLLIMIHNYMATLYRQEDIYDKALESAYKSKNYCILSHDTSRMMYALRNIGRIYLFQERSDSSFYYYNKALELAEKSHSIDAKATILNELGACYRQVSDYENAIRFIQSSIPLKNANERYSSYLSLARLYFELNQLDSVEYYLDHAKNSKNLVVHEGVYQYNYELAKARGDYKKAIEYNECYQSLRDSISHANERRNILILTYKYDYKELKNKLETQAAQERLFYILFILFLLAATAVGGYCYIRYRWRQEKLLRLQEKRLQQEKELRLQSLEQIRLNAQQIRANELKLKSKEEDLKVAQRELLVYNSRFLNVENELIKLKREEREFKNKLFQQTGVVERIKAAGVDCRKKDISCVPFTMKDYPMLVEYLNEYYEGFTDRLCQMYPKLKEQDVKVCCLVKAGAKTGNISSIISMTPNAVTKKKGQILKKMEIVDQAVSLEQVLRDF